MGTVDYHGAKRFMTFFFFPQDLMAQVFSEAAATSAAAGHGDVPQDLMAQIFLKRQLPVRPQAMGMTVLHRETKPRSRPRQQHAGNYAPPSCPRRSGSTAT